MLGIVVERGGARGPQALALYVDGRVRVVGPRTVIAVEPGVIPDLPLFSLTVTGAPGPRDPAPLGPGQLRLAALTLGGVSVLRERLPRALIAWTVPLG